MRRRSIGSISSYETTIHALAVPVNWMCRALCQSSLWFLTAGRIQTEMTFCLVSFTSFDVSAFIYPHDRLKIGFCNCIIFTKKMVEAAGIEPASQADQPAATTCLA